MKIRFNKDGSYDRYKATFYEDEILTIAHCLNFVLGLVEQQQQMGAEPFADKGELDMIIDVANKCNQLVAQLPKEDKNE